MLWIDTLRGALIILVVAGHCVVAARDLGSGSRALDQAQEALRTVRMPGFFLISGLMASQAIDRPWRDLWATRVGTLLWTFLLWAGVSAAVGVAGLPNAGLPTEPSQAALAIAMVNTSQWYLAGLAVFYGAARLCVRVPAMVQLGVLAAASVAFGMGWVHTGSWGIDEMGWLAVWFFLGVHAAKWLFRVAEQSRAGIAVAGVALWLGGVLALRAFDVRDLWLVVLPVVGAPTAVATAASISRIAPRVAAPAAALGRVTLPVYVLHMPLAAALAPVCAALLPRPLVAPGLCVATAVAVLAAWSATKRVSWLYALPRSLSGRSGQLAQHQAVHAQVGGGGVAGARR